MRKPALAALAILAVMAAPATPEEPEPFVPVYRANFPDPFVLPHKGRYLAYATNAERDRANVQMAVSEDLVNWAPLKDGAQLLLDGTEQPLGPLAEYPAIYARFAALVRARAIAADGEPLRILADATLVARRTVTGDRP